jgi:hypothetical protein
LWDISIVIRYRYHHHHHHHRPIHGLGLSLVRFHNHHKKSFPPPGIEPPVVSHFTHYGVTYEGKDKVVPLLNQVPSYDDVCGNGGTAPRVLNLGGRWR